MPGLVLRVKSPHFDADRFLSESDWAPDARWADGFNLLVSEAEEFKAQVADALSFISANEARLENLAAQTNGGSIELDFGIFASDGLASSVAFSSDAMRSFGECGFDVRISTYVPSAT